MTTDLPADFKAYQASVTGSLLNVTRSATSISSHDLSFHRTLSSKVSKSLDSQNSHLLRLTSKLLKAATKETNIKTPAVPDKDGIEDNWRKIVDVIDDLLEKADANLDEFNGLIKRQSSTQPSTPEPLTATSRKPALNTTTYGGVTKPQVHFARQVDNHATGRWQPLLKAKPHATISLEHSVGSEESGFKHPYAYEIEHLQYPQSVYQESLPVPFSRPENSEPVWVDTEEDMLSMLEELKTAKEIAIDLEHNDKNSYVGLVCLMQISTRSRDWVVDTLKPWRENLQILNEVFANPNIVKVFHGSASDMIWLQRDLGLYVVGLFDTYHAACALQYPHRGLAFLLQKFANFNAQKQYQLADWRVRPLPQELLDYARSDTHYLLYVYDNMRNALIKQSTPDLNLTDYVLDNSKKESLQIYERHQYDRENGLGPEGFLKLFLTKNVRTLDKQQFAVFRALHEWRDNKAREFDEGIHSIMTNAYLWNCAEAMPEYRGQLFNQRVMGGRASYTVGQYSQEVLNTIKKAKDVGDDAPTVQGILERNADKLSAFRQFKHANPRAKPQEVQQSVAATMQQLVQNGDIKQDTTIDDQDSTEPLARRSISSNFWGKMQTVPSQPVLDPATAQMALMSIMPVQNLTNGAPVLAEPQNGIETTTPSSLPSPSANGDIRIVEEPNMDVPFTLKDRKKKRAADELEATDDDVPFIPTNTDQFAVTDEGEVLTQRAAQRAAKKARKEAERAAEDAEAATFEPFDYANAQSILNPSKQPASLRSYAGSRPDKPFNPFQKALDTTTGAKRNRLGKELAGKSHTFKS